MTYAISFGLSAYNSPANAADLDDLRQALGYAQWNLYGISYGTLAALAWKQRWWARSGRIFYSLAAAAAVFLTGILAYLKVF